MEENKNEGEKQEENSRHHFTKVIEYNNEPWLTDFIFGRRGTSSHGHATASGAMLWYLRDEQGREIIKNGSIVTQSDFTQSNQT